jgi:uncharacterized MAPEG superfamily protein
MSVELQLLVWSAILTLVQSLIAVLGAILQVGLPKLAGNREALPEFVGWAGRARRAYRNMLESFALFAALVLTAQVAGRTNAMTALGAELFFCARLVYVPVYLLGIPWLRTAIWGVSVVGLVLLIQALL